MPDKKMPLARQVLGEFIGTFILVFVGCGAISLSVLEIVKLSLMQVAILWGLGLTLAIYITTDLSGAHLNPAVTIALAVWRKFGNAKTYLTYIVSQLVGAFFAGGALYLLLREKITSFEKVSGIIRGINGSELSAMMFGEYFPNPAIKAYSVGATEAFLVEFVGTAALVFSISLVTAPKRQLKMAPALIGATLTILIFFLAPFTQAGLNPARDFGPRLMSYFAGWGNIAIPGPKFGYIIYIIAPIAGGLFGGGLNRLLIRPR